MAKKLIRKNKQPGELLHIGDKKIDLPLLHLFSYNEKEFSETRPFPVKDLVSLDYNREDKTTWLNLYGLHDVDVVMKIGSLTGTDKMVLEDLLNTHHRPKIEEFPGYFFFTLKVLKMKSQVLETEQISFIVSQNYLISFQEDLGDFFDHIRDRIRNNTGAVRQKKGDYLLYLMIDALLDNYYLLDDEFEKEYKKLNYEIIHKPNKDTAFKIEKLKNNLTFIRKTLSPLRESILRLEKGNSFIQQDNQKYFTDLKDSSLEIIDSFDTYMHLLESCTHLYFSLISNRTNETMKVLTIISSIFIPLTFIVGVYGMNFIYFPELGWEYSYPVLWGIMISISVGMMLYFKKKKWL
ncbi:MAG: magnesium and cobalt transport protein CorA [Bacteroidetes bacterium GWF2_38_335]|nr:MAG: magnesium and cobalt transport protein CorA [Bacteroidetes bacterium GWF2_38_335]OFY78578.1 MAG: magnesium and cobalt transport protein CorA [Bacteroidetes bacterium RIFOXYA12_FULL_38_20]HBS85074.1 magnesium and cobalt transport protein CorA [Bacteroidales bacterium]